MESIVLLSVERRFLPRVLLLVVVSPELELELVPLD